jgi:2-polyprenyl-3-methyl-5-hydroxy-6-metoxy-1,4-benzoquinol methylase
MRRVLLSSLRRPLVRAGLRLVRRRRTPPVAPPGRLLEVGCAAGIYLDGMRQLGWQVEGIEIAEDAAQIAQQELGLDVHVGDANVLLAALPAAHYDVVAMWHVLEHLHDPAGALADVARVLRPGGLLMLELPNLDSPFAALFGESWFPLEIPRHLYHFSAPTLRAMLARAGLQLRGPHSVRGVLSPETLVWSARRAWESWRRRPPEESLSLNPMLLALALPPSWLAAQLRASDHLAVSAWRPE